MNSYVPYAFQMDPETDDVLIDGTELRDGMVVLIFEDMFRARLNNHTGIPIVSVNNTGDETRKQAQQYNLWCKVTKLRAEGNAIKFVGVYDNGLKFVFNHTNMAPWYVKKDSIPAEEPKKDSYQVGKEIGYSAGYKKGYDNGYEAKRAESVEDLRSEFKRGEAYGYDRAIREFYLNVTALGNDPEIEPATGLKIAPNPQETDWTVENCHVPVKTLDKPSLKHLAQDFDGDVSFLDEAVEEEQLGIVIRDVKKD